MPIDKIRNLRRLRSQNRDAVSAYLFLSPAFLIVGVFGLFPIGFSVFMSLFQWRIKPGRFLGLGNYFEIFGDWQNLVTILLFALGLILVSRWKPTSRTYLWTARAVLGGLTIGLFLFLGGVWSTGDADMLRSLQITVWFALGTVPLQMVFGLALALAMDSKFHGRKLFRLLFLLPYIVPIVASAGVFDILFSLRPESMANQVLHFFGLSPLQWLRESKGIAALAGFSWGDFGNDPMASWLSSWLQGPSLALVCILIFNIWLYSGYYALIFSNGLAAVPKEIYEAAKLDGARKSTLLFRIILPLLSPTSYFLVLLGVIGTFKTFTSVYVLRDAATGGAADPSSIYIFFTFFRDLRYGYASALAFVLFLIILSVTLAQRRLFEKRVFYG